MSDLSADIVYQEREQTFRLRRGGLFTETAYQ